MPARPATHSTQKLRHQQDHILEDGDVIELHI